MSRKKNSIMDESLSPRDEQFVDGEVADYGDEETVDISQFAGLYQTQNVESEEGKKIAELMASLSAQQPSKSHERKNKKEKKKKRSKKYRADLVTFEDESDQEYEEIIDENTYDDQPVIDDSYELDSQFAPDFSAEEEPQDQLPDFDESVDVKFDQSEEKNEVLSEEDAYEESIADYDDDVEYYEDAVSDEYDEYDEYVPEELTENESSEEETDENEIIKEKSPEIEQEIVGEESFTETVQPDKNTSSKKGWKTRLKAFWLGSEDFEEKFDEDFDPSVFDDEKSVEADSIDDETEEKNDEAQNDETKEIDDSEEFKDIKDDNVEETEKADTVDEYDESAENEDYEEADDDESDKPKDDEFDEESESSADNQTFFGKLKAFWNGEDIKNKNIELEEITDEEIEAEVEAEKLAWGKSNIKYDDLDEYAPKQQAFVESADIDDSDDFAPIDAEYKTQSSEGVFASMIGRFKAFLKPSLSKGNEDLVEDEIDDEVYQNDEQSEPKQNDDDRLSVEDDEDEKIVANKSFPIEQIKKMWNEDGEYADEQDAEDDDDSDEPIDADYEQPVITKPVFTVIDPSKALEDDSEDVEEADEIDEVEDEAEASAEDEFNDETEDGRAENESEIIGEDDDIITEDPDAPVDIVVSQTRNPKKNLISKIKGFLAGKKNKEVQPKDKSQQVEEKAESVHPKTEVAEEKEPSTEVAAAVTQPVYEEPSKTPEDAATFEQVAKESVAINEVGGRQVVNGHVVPEYVHESLVDKISLTNENLPVVVRREYEEYIRQALYRPKADDPVPEVHSEVSKVAHEEMLNPEKSAERVRQARLEQQKAAEEKEQQKAEKEQKTERRSIKDVLFGDVENSADFSEFRAQSNLNPQNDQVIEDYDKPSDARAIRAEINYDNRKVSFRCIALGIIFAVTLALYVVQRYFPTALTANIPNAGIMTCIINLLLVVVSAVLCYSTIIGGLKPLIAFKGNSDTAVAVAVVGCIAQGVVSFFEPQEFFSGGMHLYAILAITALMLNNLGKLCIVRRIRDNFKFVSSPNRKYAARIYDDEDISLQMIEKTNAEKPVVALQSRTRFIKGFLRFSYMPDPSERAASILAPITTAIAVVVAIICGISNASVASSVSSFALMACMGIPMCCLLAVNIPMRKLCSDSLKNRAMIVGYPAVKTFADTRAVMIDSRELYPRGKVQLLSVKTFNAYNIDKALLNAAAVMKVANTPMTYMFEDVISEKGEQLPEVESVKYEDGKGLVSWVGGERLLLGNRDLMTKYSINLPSIDFEESSVESRSNCITYLANAGQLVAMLVTDYQADPRLAQELKRLENNGVTLLIRTADPNVSQLKIARDFGIFIRSIKILPTALGNICKDEMSKKDESSRAFISTEGKLHSMARTIAGCIKIKDNILIAIVIQIIAVLLGVVIAGIVSIFAELNGLNGIDLLFYIVFWTAASIIAPLLRKA